MANFHTHLSVALAISTAVATFAMALGVFDFFDMVMLSLAGMIGGLLPDIDLDHSKITRIGFNIASIFGASFLVLLFAKYRTISLIDMLIFWGMMVLILRFGVLLCFSRLTRHRGMVHSVPYMALLSLIFVNFCFYGLHIQDGRSWLLGLFLFFGALIHLLLDEIFSVNVFGIKIKKSFGSAFKFFESKKAVNYILLYGVLVLLFVLSPPKRELWEMMTIVLNHFYPPKHTI